MKFLHISDVHYCPQQAGRLSKQIWETLLEYLKSEHFQVDELFFTGDYRHAKLQSKQDIESVLNDSAEMIEKIVSATGITDLKHVHIIPGNHDRSRLTTRVHNRIRNSYNSASGAISIDYQKLLVEQFDFFYSLCDRIYGEKNPWHNRPLNTYVITENAAILYLNTAIMHNSSNDRGNLIAVSNYLYEILKELKESVPELPKIVLAHHAVEYFNDDERKAVEAIFRDNPVELYLCGDSHKIWWRHINGYLEITMGSLQSGKNAQNVFLYGDTDSKTYSAREFRGMFGEKYAWAPFEQFNKSLLEACSHEITIPSITKQEIEKYQSQLSNDCILPWLKHSTSYKAIFPKLFMKPSLYDEKMKKAILFDDLILDYTRRNIVFVGEAGFGKSTLLRYFFLYKNKNYEFLYLRAQVLEMEIYSLTPYERKALSYLTGKKKTSKHRVIILDGMDELSPETLEKLDSIAAYHNTNNPPINIWFGWRSEYNTAYETETLRYFIEHIISLQKWEFKLADRYVKLYSDELSRPELYSTFEELMSSNPTFKGFTESPFQLVMLVYLLENDGLKIVKDYLNNSEPSLYSLYELFVECWLKKEKSRGTSTLSKNDIIDKLQDIAYSIYPGKTYTVDTEDTAVRGLLVFSAIINNETDSFYHRSFCAFFCAQRIYNALKDGTEAAIYALKQSYKNDVTDFVRSAFASASSQEIVGIFDNLKKIYVQSLDMDNEILDVCSRNALKKLTSEEMKYLKNELLYFVTRLPIDHEIVSPFVELVYRNETDPHMKLDLAYGAVLTGPEWIALEYARALREDEKTSLINRSWTTAYFGDAQGSPYTHIDNENLPWTKARTARLKHLASSNKKAMRFRILEIPILYCFYSSRNWKDVNEEDYEIINVY